MKKKIAVIGLKGLPAFGGAATVGENIIEQLKNRYDFTVYSVSSHTDLKSGKFNGFHQIIITKIPFKRLNSLWYYICSVTHALLFGKYDLIHFHHRDATFLLPLLRTKFKVILTTHGYGTGDLSDKWNMFKYYYVFQEKIFIRYANIITTMSKFDIRLIKRNTKNNVWYIPNGINIPNISQSIDNRKMGEYLLFVAGRIVSFKKCDVMLKALILNNYEGKVLIVGDLDQSQKYKSEIIELSQRLKNIEFIGLVKDKNELFEIYKNAKLFIFPSSREASSIVLLEVISMNVPVIASRIPANTQLFNDQEILYFNVNDVNDLSKKIQWALNNFLDMKLRAENAYNKITRNYTWKKIGEKYQRIYNEMLI